MLTKKKIIFELEKLGVETRPIISGNFLNQPAIKLLKLNQLVRNYLFAKVDDRVFIGINTLNLT